MRTYHVYRVTFEDGGQKPSKIDYFVGKSIAQAFSHVANLAGSGVPREILSVERVLANVMNPDVPA